MIFNNANGVSMRLHGRISLLMRSAEGIRGTEVPFWRLRFPKPVGCCSLPLRAYNAPDIYSRFGMGCKISEARIN